MMWIIVILLCASCYLSYGAKILGVLVTESKSHYYAISNVADELALRGHKVTLVLPSVLTFPARSTVRYSVYTYPFDEHHMAPESPSRSLLEIGRDGQTWQETFMATCRSLLLHIQYHKKELSEFDLMFSESPPECGAIVSEFLQLQRIDIKPAAFGMRLYRDMSLVSYIPEIFSSGSDKMSFAERIENFIYHTLLTMTSPLYFGQYDGIRREFGLPENRRFQDSINMAEMVIIFGHFALEYPQPILPATKVVGPLSIKPPNPLPKDLEQFISGAGDKGIILFSLGTLGDAMLQKRQVEMMASVFRRLEQRTIWRLKRFIPNDLSSNIKVTSWVPQNDILAHKSTKAFISHAGLNSLYEAAFYGVPLVCVPLFGDQHSNCVQAQAIGMATGTDIMTATGDEIYNLIKRVLKEQSFKGNTTRISRLLRDSPRTPVQQAADWIDYVHRHKGAKHLRSEVYNLYWYQYYLLDVILFILSALIAVCSAIRLLFRLLCKTVTKIAKIGHSLKKKNKSYRGLERFKSVIKPNIYFVNKRKEINTCKQTFEKK